MLCSDLLHPNTYFLCKDSDKGERDKRTGGVDMDQETTNREAQKLKRSKRPKKQKADNKPYEALHINFLFSSNLDLCKMFLKYIELQDVNDPSIFL